ncbi:hypothetical protein GobsT_15000 [Gemmata obscuriglobus]|uniref:Alpha 1,4-glycosyltransferase domain-containing protein n=1 Tax=Gemmata obscuriglobus TaxID=114 RepID=A0A2Z3H5C3_9BACT|nr:glycosyltransferase [Gemmata obscuriglobus]AWM40081.1 hypothetical protein C1280_25805 [Gemmata obscuriglobus]QEG26753.1 hypothetical protein GobsT_15000 [Gemmata obscuriglobus]VTS02549.1 Uncharacterized protein OS=Opitutus terrae (strain DSM 11246 / PB90-1) GN=Oter_2764 PE=4 SV=1: Gly_transf_sug [Gemmata obscuriglobus UQM 2246]
MTDPNRVVQGLWIGPSLSAMEQLSIRSFLAHGHDYHLYVYSVPTGVPKGTVLKDANEIIDRSRIWFYKHDGFASGSVSGFSELFRYALLHQRGGWWVDSDVVCLKAFDHPGAIVIATSNEAEHGVLPCTFVLKFPAGGPYTKYLLKAADRPDPERIGYLSIGPFLVQKMVTELGLQEHLAAPEMFAPIGWRGLSRIVRQPGGPTLKSVYRYFYWRSRWLLHPRTHPGAVRRSSYALHLWNEFWREGGLDKNKEYARGCLFERLKRRYLGAEAS